MVSTYILMDTTLIGNPVDRPWIKKRRRPSWLAAIYDRKATDVSPILIDIERARECNRLDCVMALVNSNRPQLGISFLETELSLSDLQAHFQQFIYVETESGSELTLRFADCLVLAVLPAILRPGQWALLVAPFQTWRIHDRGGELKALPMVEATSTERPPLVLGNEQISAAHEAAATDLLLFNLRKLRPGRSSEYSTTVAYERADQARKLWLSAGHSEDAELLLFARDVFDSEGQLLRQPGLVNVLKQADDGARRKDLHRLAKL